MLRKIKRDFVVYMTMFVAVLKKQLSTEFEVQVRGGTITREGQEILTSLRNDFSILQYQVQIRNLIEKNLTTIS